MQPVWHLYLHWFSCITNKHSNDIAGYIAIGKVILDSLKIILIAGQKMIFLIYMLGQLFDLSANNFCNLHTNIQKLLCKYLADLSSFC